MSKYKSLNEKELHDLLVSKTYPTDDYFEIHCAWESKIQQRLGNVHDKCVAYMHKFVKKSPKKAQKQVESKHFNFKKLLKLSVFDTNKNSFYQDKQTNVSLLLEHMTTSKLDCSDLSFTVVLNENGDVIDGMFIWC